MNGWQLIQSRLEKGLEQQEAAEKLGISQSYLSLLETGKRKLPLKLAARFVKVFDLPPEKLPFETDWENPSERSNDELAEMLAALGYPKFSHLSKGKIFNPAEVLLAALKKENLDIRTVEALPWLVFSFPEMDWERVKKLARMFDLQNRLGFVVSLAKQLAGKNAEAVKKRIFSNVEKSLENSRLFREDVLGNKSLTTAEKKYLKTNRPKEARKWRVLSDLSVEYLD